MGNSKLTGTYPLEWPEGWPRTEEAKRRRASFSSKQTEYGQRRADGTTHSWVRTRELTIDAARRRLSDELDRLGATHCVLSTNVILRNDGLPRSDRRSPDDPGAAVYFQRRGKPYSLACDQWDRVADNVAAIAKHIEAMRGMERWGVGSLDRIFAGFAALPPPGGVGQKPPRPWREVLEIPKDIAPHIALRLAEVTYRDKAKSAHPDAGGQPGAMEELNAAIAAARSELEKAS